MASKKKVRRLRLTKIRALPHSLFWRLNRNFHPPGKAFFKVRREQKRITGGYGGVYMTLKPAQELFRPIKSGSGAFRPVTSIFVFKRAHF